jgi:hypothetical protein
MITERRIRGGKVYELQLGPRSTGDWLQSSMIIREVEPTAEEREQMVAARRAMEHIRGNGDVE